MKLEYAPKSLTAGDRKKQVKSIREKKDRPKVKSFKSKRSSHTIEFEKKYGTKINDVEFITKNLIQKEGMDKILNKGRGAYYSSGSRPNQTPESWALARLASVLVGGDARRIDFKIWKKYKK